MCAHVSARVCPATESSRCKKRESANYNIKAVSANDLSAFARRVITLNQERSAVDVAPMHKLATFANAHGCLCFLLTLPASAAKRLR